jgi:hypothetical protein
MTMTVHKLKILNGVLNVDHSSWTELGVERAAFDKLVELLSAQIQRGRQIPSRTTIDVSVAMGFDLFAKGGIARRMSKLDHGLALEGCRKPLLTVVGGDFIQRIGQEPFAPVRAEADVEMEDAFLPGLDPLQQFLSEAFEIFAVLNAGFAVGSAGLRICPLP